MLPHTKSKTLRENWLFKALIIVGTILLIVIIIVMKNQRTVNEQRVDELPELQFDRLLKNNQPALVFFHSNNCQSCIEMIHVVEQVYPEFKDDIALVDVNVYDERNQSLLGRAGINSIPTQIFINSKGEGKIAIGMMEPDKLRQLMLSIKEQP
jgi:thiol-disulfide isomerase/thioredoxin